jgi:hypothetical protein
MQNPIIAENQFVCISNMAHCDRVQFKTLEQGMIPLIDARFFVVAADVAPGPAPEQEA